MFWYFLRVIIFSFFYLLFCKFKYFSLKLQEKDVKILVFMKKKLHFSQFFI